MEPTRAELRAGQLRACGIWASILRPEDPNSDLIVALEDPDGSHVKPEIMMLSVAEQYLLRQAEKAEASEEQTRLRIICAQYAYLLSGVKDIVAVKSDTLNEWLIQLITTAEKLLVTQDQVEWQKQNVAIVESSKRIMDNFVNQKRVH